MQFTEFVLRNHLHEKSQSAYKSFHSVETALLWVLNDLLCAMDSHESVLLILLDLSAAFDTVDHCILLERLSNRFGIRGSALAWFKSYLTGRFQTVCIQGKTSTPKALTCGVPQGSVLGPLLFTAYTAPLGDIAKRHNVDFHFYADDTQLYLGFKPSNEASTKQKMEACIQDIRVWMAFNFLKLNDSKTEMLVMHPKRKPSREMTDINIGDSSISRSNFARNIGVIFDENLTLERHVRSVTSSAFFHIRNIGLIRKYLNQEATETLVHAFVSSRLDFCNSLLYGLPQWQLKKLQYVQNTAARLITRTRKGDHITPVLEALHWLPIHQRIEFKLLLLVFKSLHDLAPQYLAELLIPHKPSRPLRSCDMQLLVTPRTVSRYGDRAFRTVAPALWNKLPYSIRNCETISSFKNCLKTYLFKCHYTN